MPQGDQPLSSYLVASLESSATEHTQTHSFSVVKVCARNVVCAQVQNLESVFFILAQEEIFAQCSESLARTKDLRHNRMLLGAHFE